MDFFATEPDSHVRRRAVEALGSVFSHVPDKEQAWNDLHRLATDENSLVISFTNLSLGKVSIFKASKTEKEEDYKKELERAIEFFEIAAQESTPECNTQSKFCLPFYRAFYTLTLIHISEPTRPY